MMLTSVCVVNVSTPQLSRMKSSKNVSSITSRSIVGLPPCPAPPVAKAAGTAAMDTSSTSAGMTTTGLLSLRVERLIFPPVEVCPFGPSALVGTT